MNKIPWEEWDADGRRLQDESDRAHDKWWRARFGKNVVHTAADRLKDELDRSNKAIADHAKKPHMKKPH